MYQSKVFFKQKQLCILMKPVAEDDKYWMQYYGLTKYFGLMMSIFVFYFSTWYTMNIFDSKSGHLNYPQIFAIFDDFPEFWSTFCSLHFGKSSNTAKFLKKMKKNLPIIPLLLKLSLFEPEKFELNLLFLSYIHVKNN